MANKDWFKSVLVYLCITFFLFTLAFVYMSLRGKPQAGLIEVGGCAILFVILLHVVMRVLALSSGIISSALSIILALILIYSNFHLQKSENKDYTFHQILVGDLFAKKFIKEDDVKKHRLPKKEFNKYKVEPIDNVRTTTEKYTLESPFEKPERMDLGDTPVKVVEAEAIQSPIIKLATYNLKVPQESVSYKLQFMQRDGFELEKTGDSVVQDFEMIFFNKEMMLNRSIEAPINIPTDPMLNKFPLMFDEKIVLTMGKKDKFPLISDEIEQAESQISDAVIFQIENMLQKP